MTTIKLVNTF